jgi:hypothetical protein
VIGDEAGTPSKIPDLPIKLYRKAKNGRRHKVSSHGTSQFPEERVFGSLGVLRLQGPMGARS